MQEVFSLFTNCLQFHYQNPFRFFLSPSQDEISPAEKRTRIASSPMHSILCHGMTRSCPRPIPKNPPGRGTTSAVILPSQRLNSKSHGHPSFVPSHKLITSFCRKSQVKNRSIIKAPLHSVLLTIYAKEPIGYSFFLLRRHAKRRQPIRNDKQQRRQSRE